MSEPIKAPKRIYAGPIKPVFTNKKTGKTGEWVLEPLPNYDVPYVLASEADMVKAQRDKLLQALRDIAQHEGDLEENYSPAVLACAEAAIAECEGDG